MAIMTCPRCGGSGKFWEGFGSNTTLAPHESVCPSCGGRGYVTDTQVIQPRIDETDGTSSFDINWITPIVTREPDRIDRILASIRAIWRMFPDWRLGQLLTNAITEFEADIFYLEDTILEERLDKFEKKLGDVGKLLDAM